MIVQDPKVMFGSPTIKGTRLTTSNIYSLYLGGDSVKMIARMFDISEYKVRQAIKYEQK